MQNDLNNIQGISNDELDLRELLFVIFDGRWIVSSITLVLSISAVFFSLSLPNIYQSEALLVPVDSTDGISGAMQNYSGLASLAGVNLSSQGDNNNAAQAFEKLTSLSFFEKNIIPNIFLPELMAIESWDPKTNKLIFDKNIYDEVTDSWVRDYEYPKKPIPTAQESFVTFKTNHLTINEDKKTGFILIAVKHQSPYVAKKWVELVIDQINAFYREKDKEDAQKAVSFLNSQIAKTNFTEIKQVIAELLQQETQKLTLIEVNESYVFEYIDPPAVMEEKAEPKRALICIFGAIFGLLMGIFVVLIREYGIKSTDK